MTSTENRFEFRGSAKEWFGIWIVNLLLSAVTIGIYSAWAKVRTKKYFYQNTYVAGRNFDYHATGKQILIGRLIVIGALVVYSIVSAVQPVLGLLMLLGLIAIFPFLIVRSAAFNARQSSWANVRFNFDGRPGTAFLVYLIYPVLCALTLYTTFPFLTRAMQRFGINNHSLGQMRFKFDSGVGAFYKAFLLSGAIILAGGVFFALIAAPALPALDSGELEPALVTALVAGYFVLIVSLVFGGMLYRAMIRNHVYNSTLLGEKKHGFVSDISVGSFVWIALSNAIVTVASLGLMLPWAQVRMHRYLAGHTALAPNGPLDDLKGEVLASGNAIGDAYSDIEGVDLGLAI